MVDPPRQAPVPDTQVAPETYVGAREVEEAVHIRSGWWRVGGARGWGGEDGRGGGSEVGVCGVVTGCDNGGHSVGGDVEHDSGVGGGGGDDVGGGGGDGVGRGRGGGVGEAGGGGGDQGGSGDHGLVPRWILGGAGVLLGGLVRGDGVLLGGGDGVLRVWWEQGDARVWGLGMLGFLRRTRPHSDLNTSLTPYRTFKTQQPIPQNRAVFF